MSQISLVDIRGIGIIIIRTIEDKTGNRTKFVRFYPRKSTKFNYEFNHQQKNPIKIGLSTEIYEENVTFLKNAALLRK